MRKNVTKCGKVLLSGGYEPASASLLGCFRFRVVVTKCVETFRGGGSPGGGGKPRAGPGSITKKIPLRCRVVKATRPASRRHCKEWPS